MPEQPDCRSEPKAREGCAGADQVSTPKPDQGREPTPMPGLAKGDAVRKPLRPADEPGGDGDF